MVSLVLLGELGGSIFWKEPWHGGCKPLLWE